VSRAESIIRGLLEQAGVTIGGPAPHDLQVHDRRFYERVVVDGSLGLGESYMDGWWSCAQLDEFFCRVLQARLDYRVKLPWREVLAVALAKVRNRQSPRRAQQIATVHYDLSAEFFETIMDPRMVYSCGYWKNATTLEQAQEDKLDLISRKLGLRASDRVLDIGCGWGSFVTFAYERYRCPSVGVTISGPQAEYSRRRCAGKPITILASDYREINRHQPGRFEKVVSVGMFEHVGPQNYRTFMRVVDELLVDDGLFLLQTVGDNFSRVRCDAWLDKYIFPNGVAPSIGQVGRAIEGIFVVEDWHNFGPDYYTTLMAWYDNLRKHHLPGERVYRMWEYFYTSFASAFKMRRLQLWQIVMSKGTIPTYTSVR
jgi:cyclopropane-fatty-acyl-phospholipid synthase